MISSVARSGPLAASLVASSQAVPSAVRQIIPAFSQAAEKFIVQPTPEAHTNFTLSSRIPRSSVSLNQRISNGIGVTSQVRYAHSDVQVPDFTAYRRDGTKDANRSSEPSGVPRKTFTYVIMAGGGVTCGYAAKSLVTELVTSMSASADVLALAKIEIKLSDIPEGKSAVFKWRNKPLFVRHRTADEIAREEAVDVSTLRDQQHDSERVQKPEWLILLGVCTHLGCVPIDGLGDYGGYYCPCHGSHYDASGRIRKGPAPLNLEVPEYEFMDEENLIVG